MSAVPGKSLWSVYSGTGDARRAREMAPINQCRVVDGRGAHKRAATNWNRVYHEVIVALVTALPHRAPEGICHLAADIADAAAAERQRRQGGAL